VTDHEAAAVATLEAATGKGARISPSMREGIIGVGRAWDRAEEIDELKVIPQLAARMLEWATAINGLIPTEGPDDAFAEIGRTLNVRNRVPRRSNRAG